MYISITHFYLLTPFLAPSNKRALDWNRAAYTPYHPPMPHKGIPSDWLPPFIADALNKIIGYTTKMTQRKTRLMSIESLYCAPSLELLCLKIQFTN